MKDRIALLAAAFWWGSLATIGFLVVPMLFARLGSPAVAGNMAGQLFAAQTWVALACGLVLLVHFRAQAGERHRLRPRGRSSAGSLTALLLALAAAVRGGAADPGAREPQALACRSAAPCTWVNGSAPASCSGAWAAGRPDQAFQKLVIQRAGRMNRKRRLRRPARASGGLHSP